MKRASAATKLVGIVLGAVLPLACSTPSPGPPRPSDSTRAHSPPNSPPPPAVSAAAGYRSVLIEGVPHIEQKPDFCGEAAAAMYLRALGKPYSQDDVFGLSGMDPARGMGATTRELKTALEQIGFVPGPVWHRVAGAHPARQIEALFAAMHADLERGIPSIVCMHYDDRPNTTEHFRLVLGYDATTDEVIYHEPAVQNGSYRRMARASFVRRWPLRAAPAEWSVIRLRLDKGELRDPSKAPKHSRAELAQHVRRLRRTLPAGFTVVVEPPFVVLGDERPELVRQRAARTVRWAVERLKLDFFSDDPNDILDIWLFKDARSYRHWAHELFGDNPSTPYGYYDDKSKALVMNIATGGGTLVHEIVHPFVEANFPNCPAWFNEGLGSLYEQSSSRDGHIIGLTNWRLAGLQRAIRSGPLPSFRQLTATTSYQFYEQDPGTNYAQARYLLYYLQERGLLVRYYHAFLANAQQDPTGYETLKAVLGENDLTAFQKRWEAYVLTLRFP